MRAYDFTIAAPNSTGSLATLAEEMGKENVNIEGLCVVENNEGVICHLMTTDRAGALRVLNRIGYRITFESEVMVEYIEDRPGVLGEVMRRVADAGIDVTTAYLATNTRLVLGGANGAALESAWQKVPLTAAR